VTPIASSEPALARVAPPEPASAADEIPIDAIDPNPEQPRRRFDPEQLERLGQSIRQHGVLQPVVLRRAGERFELVVGERRWRAARGVGRTTIPAVVLDVDPRERLELALVENVQRRDLNPIELAHAFRALADGGATQEQIGERVGLDRSTIANHLRLLELTRELQEDVELGRLGVGHAKALLQVTSPERRRHLRERIVREQLSVRAAEQLAQHAGAAAAPARRRASPDPDRQRLTDRLRQRLQTRVKIQGDSRRGRIEIEYFGSEDLARLAGLLLGDA
jgi:ParB family chromosome partitioning protein